MTAASDVSGPDNGPDNASVSPPSLHHDEPESARGATTLSDVLHDASTAGSDGEFEVVSDDGSLRCSHCTGIVDADAVDRAWSRRLEGASDPDDMLHVSALTCPACGGRGVFVAQFGAASSTAESAVLSRLRDRGVNR